MALRSDGGVRCWGSNGNGQCNVPTNLGTCSGVAGGRYHTIALQCMAGVNAPASPELAPFSFANPRSWTVSGIETTSTGATITVNARGNLGTATKFLSLKVDGVTLATNIFGSGSGTTNCATAISTATFTIPPAQFLKLTTDGALEVRIEPSSNATSAGCMSATLTVNLNYTRDAIDCNGNGLDDECDIASASSIRDCNNNLLLDSCEIASGASDTNLNGRLDSCEVDCNGNGLPDTYELANNLVPDCNSNARPDACDVAIGGGSNDVDHNGIPDECKADCNNNGLPDTWEIFQGTAPDCNTNAVPDTCDIAASPSLDCNHNGVIDSCEGGSTGNDCDNNGQIDSCEIAGNAALDCNLNSTLDSCDIAADPALDCNQSGTFDTCDIANNSALDCNNSGTLDSCDIAAGTAIDCNLNDKPDSCDIAAGTEDDNQNGRLDSCELLYGDLNLDERIDGADLGAMLSLWGYPNPPYGDLNGDHIITGADLGLLLSHWGDIN